MTDPRVPLRVATATDTKSDIVMRVGAIALSLLIAIALAIAMPDGPIERSLNSLRYSINSKPASGQVHIVEIDAKSLAELDSWPWPRSNHAQLVDALVKAGADQVVFDVDFSSRSTPAEDQAFADAISRAQGKVVLPTFRQPATNNGAKRDIESLPPAALREHAFLGSVNVRPDATGQVNTYPFGTVTDATPRPSLGALLANANGPVTAEFKIDQSIEIDTIPRHSFVDIMQGRFDPAAVKGKRMLIGATAIEMGDRYATERFGVIPGVIIQAMAAETLIAGPPPLDLGPAPLLCLALLCMMFGSWYCRGGKLIGLTPTIFTALLAFAVAVLCNRWGIARLDLVPALGLTASMAIASYVIGLIQKTSQERRVDRDTNLPNQTSWRDQKSIAGGTVVFAELVNLGEILSTLEDQDSGKFLQAVAERLQLSVGEGQLYCFGRGRFCWAAPTEDVEQVDAMLAGTASLFNAPFAIGGRTLRATVCFGASKADAAEPANLSNKAALAAKRAAELGVRALWYDDGLASQADQSLTIISEFGEALKSGQISVVYQPKYNLRDSWVAGAEALVRWHHPIRGPISPDVFVPILERENLLGPLTLFVLECALSDMAHWTNAGRPVGCAVNISGSLLTDHAFLSRAATIISEKAQDPDLLTLELTETAMLSSLEDAATTLAQLKKLGVRLSIDDYGTGQSTLSYLKNFAADEIKIDQSFVRQIVADNANRIMVHSTIEMAHALGVKVVAEGVENAAVMDMLRQFDCDTIQGWHIGKAVPCDEFLQLWCRADQNPIARRA